jgi:hypothetical protein
MIVKMYAANRYQSCNNIQGFRINMMGLTYIDSNMVSNVWYIWIIMIRTSNLNK